MDDEQNGWRKFQRMRFNSKTVTKRAKKAESATIRHARKFISKRLNNVLEVRRHVAIWLGGIAILIGTVGIQLIWSQTQYTVQAGANGGTYAEATLGDIDTLNPLYASTSSELAASRLIFSSLLAYDTTGHLNMDVAKSMAVNTEGTTYTLTLKDNVKWHDGSKLTAQDVAFTVDLIKNPATRSPLQLQWQDVTVKVIDDHTLTFSLPSAYAAFPHALTFAILPKHILSDVDPSSLRENAFSLMPVGSGPFDLRLLQPAQDQKIVNMNAFDDYFKGRPKLDRFEIHAYKSYGDVVSALKTGQVIAADLSETSGFTNKAIYSIHNTAVNDGVYTLFNTSQPILNELPVRQALQRAINIEKLRRDIAPGQPSLDLPFVEGQLSNESSFKPAPYSKAEAEAQLEAAGWKREGAERKKDGKTLAINLVSTDNLEYKKVIEHLKKDWQAIGVKVETSVIDTSDPRADFVQNVLQPRAYDVLVYELSIGADPDVYAYWHSSQSGPRGLNLSMYSSGVADDALTSARSRVEPGLRDLKYQAFAKQWLADVPAVGLYQSSMKYVSRTQSSALEPYQRLISPYDRYANVIYWTASEASVYKIP
ncbi:MAG: putative Extracellular solute-binding protein family 5 [Candidatus Saccharibacteria bacterium]|nr:putative Extracellular solute-binding protein family 5 [Candidatus Saccharibacteria bacterium]